MMGIDWSKIQLHEVYKRVRERMAYIDEKPEIILLQENQMKDKEVRKIIYKMLKKQRCERCYKLLFVDPENECVLLEEDFTPHLYPCLM